MIQYILFYSKSVKLVAIFFINAGFPTYLIGPIFYLYIRSVLNDSTKLRKLDLWHLLPMLLYLAGSFHYLVTPWSFKLEIAERIIDSGFKIRYIQSQLGWLYQHFPVLLLYLSRPLLVLGYLVWSVGMLMRYIFEGKKSTVPGKQRFMIKWLWILIGFLFIITISHSLQVIVSFEARNIQIFKTLNVLQLISAIGLAGLLISPFFFPYILYGLPRFPHSNIQPENKNVYPKNTFSDTTSAPVKQKTSPARFEKEYIDTIEQKILSCMKEYQPYLQQDFNLTQLSVLINIPAHHLAWFFKEIKKRSFTDFRNEWRIRHAQTLIKEGKTSGMTLEAIGMLSGFLSRNAFLNAFKKVEGITPRQYVNRYKS